MSDKLKYPFLPADPCLTEEQLLAYLDDQLGPELRHSAEKHMLDCGLCSDALDGLALVKDRRKIAAFVPPVADTQPEEEKKPKIIFLQQRFWMAAAASVALLLGTMWVLNNGADISKNDQNLAQLSSKDSGPQASKPAADCTGLALNSENQENPKTKIVLADTVNIVSSSISKNSLSVRDASTGGGDNAVMAAADDFVATGPSKTNDEAAKKDALAEELALLDTKKTSSSPIVSGETAVLEKAETVSSKDYRNKKKAASTDKRGRSNAPAYATATDKYKEAEPEKKSAEADYSLRSVTDSTVVVNATSTSNSSVPVTDGTFSGTAVSGNSTTVNSPYQSGLLMMQQKNYAQAIVQFDKVIATPSDANYEDARWQKALALAASGKKAEARTLLLDIEKTSAKYKSQATEKLKQL